jgi:ADP-heptose:LPS heptosyltransferase
VAVLRLRSLGDCVLTTPALFLLKQARPDLRLAVMVEDRFRAVFEDQPDTDQILPVSLRALRGFAPDLCWNLHGGTRSAWLTAASGARWRAGFAHFRHSFAYNVRIPRAQEILGVERTVHTAEHIASGAFYLGSRRIEIARARLGARQSTSSVRPESYAVIHPFASAPDKTWPAEKFVSLAQQLRAQRPRLDPVFIGGPADPLSAFSAFRCAPGTLRETKELIAQASLFIGNDSGPAHLAAAFGIPTVVIFGNSKPDIWSPWRTPSEIVSSPAGIAAVSVEEVSSALARLRVPA